MTNYWLDLFTDETWEEARQHGVKVTVYRLSRWPIVSQIKPGDLILQRVPVMRTRS